LRREQVGDAVGDSVGKYPFQDAQPQCLLARLRRIERRVLRVCHGRQRGRVLLEPLRIAVGGYLPPAHLEVARFELDDANSDSCQLPTAD